MTTQSTAQNFDRKHSHDDQPDSLSPEVVVGGMKVSTQPLEALILRMLDEAPVIRQSGDRARLIFDCNGHGLSLRANDPLFKSAVDQADLIHADGGIIVAASHFFCSGTPIANRSATTDMFLDSLAAAAEKRVSYFLLGATQSVVETCVSRLTQDHPRLNLAGYRNGYFSADEEDAVVEAINTAAPDVLWVGLGKPKEQIFCVRNRDRLKCGWIVTCGGLFNFVTGDYPRAPRWMQRVGLEWAHRLATNPRKLFWRYLTTNPHALWLIATQSRATVEEAK